MSPSTRVVVGGYFPTFSPNIIFDSLGSKVDFLVLGEGEQTFLELSQRILGGSNHFEDIHGIAYYNNGNPVFSASREIVNNLDLFPFPDRDIRFGCASVITSRGCPFNCSFCSIKNFYGRKYRTRSVGNLISELIALKRMGVKYVKFLDDNTFVSYPLFNEFYRECFSNNLQTMRFSMSVSGSLILSHPHILDKMRKMNVRGFAVGVETMDNKARELLRVKDKIRDPSELIRIIRRSSFKGNITFFQILNTGFEKSIDEVKDSSIKFLQAVKGIKNITILPALIQPWPGSDIREMFIQKGLKVADVTHLKMEESGVASKFISEKQLNDWVVEYKLLIRKQRKHYTPHSFFSGLIFFLTSSIRPITKLKMAWALFSYYIRVSSTKDPSRMLNSTKRFF